MNDKVSPALGISRSYDEQHDEAIEAAKNIFMKSDIEKGNIIRFKKPDISKHRIQSIIAIVIIVVFPWRHCQLHTLET